MYPPYMKPSEPSHPASAKTPGVSRTSNVGFVLYSKSHAPGTLNARWMFTSTYRGPGLATGGPREGFAGRYHVRYFFEDGAFSDEYDLLIEKNGDVYDVSWFVENELRAVGVGMEVKDGLAVGWRKVGA